MNWFTSDTHFGHTNVIEYCKRPFETAEAMDAEMMKRWNETVAATDTVYHLGDFAFCKRERLPVLRKALNGKIILVKGNHDRGANALRECGFDEVHTELWLEFDGVKAYLHHQPITDFKDAEIHLCGHVHDSWLTQGKIVNAGVDQHDFRPVSFEHLRKCLA